MVSGASVTNTPMCTRAEMATFDARQIIRSSETKEYDSHILVIATEGIVNVFMSLGGDAAITATSQANCMVSGVYVAGAKCLVMEAYGSSNSTRISPLIELMIALIFRITYCSGLNTSLY